MQTQTTTTEASTAETSAEAVDMQATVRRSIDSPLAALRASVESLVDECSDEDPRGDVLSGALHLIVRLSRNVRALVDYAVPPSLAPLDCTLEELARAALKSLPANLQQEVELALDGAQRSLRVDGPLLSRCLGYLVAANVCSADGALFTASSDEQAAHFSLLCQVRGRDQLRAQCATISTIPEDEDLVLILALREIARMGGEVTCSLTPSGPLRVAVRMPFDSSQEGAE